MALGPIGGRPIGGRAPASSTAPIIIPNRDTIDIVKTASTKRKRGDRQTRMAGVSAGLSAVQAFAQSTDVPIQWEAVNKHTKFNSFSLWLGTDDNFTADASADTLAVTGHGMITGDGPFQLTTTTTLPGGLSLATNYWCIYVDNDNFQVATSYFFARGKRAVDILDTGTGTHTLDRASYFVVPPGAEIMSFGGAAVTDGAGISARLQRDGADFSDNGVNGAAGGHSAAGVASMFVGVTQGERYSMVVNSSDAANRNLQPAGTSLSVSIIDPICG